MSPPYEGYDVVSLGLVIVCPTHLIPNHNAPACLAVAGSGRWVAAHVDWKSQPVSEMPEVVRKAVTWDQGTQVIAGCWMYSVRKSGSLYGDQRHVSPQHACHNTGRLAKQTIISSDVCSCPTPLLATVLSDSRQRARWGPSYPESCEEQQLELYIVVGN